MDRLETNDLFSDGVPGGQSQTRCPQYGTAGIKAASGRSALWEGKNLVVVDGIPALVCPHCREQLYDDETATILDLLRGGKYDSSEAARFVRIPVFDFARISARWKARQPEAIK